MSFVCIFSQFALFCFIRILVFGGGRRSCPGEDFAKARLFLLLTSLYQSLNIRLMHDVVHDVTSYENESLLKVPETVMVDIRLRDD